MFCFANNPNRLISDDSTCTLQVFVTSTSSRADCREAATSSREDANSGDDARVLAVSPKVRLDGFRVNPDALSTAINNRRQAKGRIVPVENR